MNTEFRDLYRKYNVAGPRYTSYPTVPYWAEAPKPEEWAASISRSLDENRRQGIGAALYVHIPFCRSLCTYCGCNTRITRNPAVSGPYIDTVLKEWALYRDRLGTSQDKIKLDELHLGGGTPTFLTPEELKRLVGGILAGADPSSESEFSVEADPRVTTREHLAALHALGFRRLSLGIQDFDPKVQDIVHRVQSEAEVRAVVDAARELGYHSVNFDLIYGLPLQTPDSVKSTIEAVQRLRPDRIAFYGYAHVPWIKPGQRRFTEADLPEGDAKRELYELGREMLEGVGYSEVGMDHFALKSDGLWQASVSGSLHRNFMGYIPRQVAPLIGLGVSAIGDSWEMFAQNEKVLETYAKRVAQGELPIFRGHKLDEEDRILRRHILNLMTRLETSWEAASQSTEFLRDLPERLGEMVRDRLIEIPGNKLQVLPKGRPFLRNICMAFDARLARQAPQTQLFSKTI